jgi:hypothetical protein
MGDKKKWEAHVKETSGKLSKKTVKAGHELGKKLKKHENGVKTPYALGMWMAKKGIKPKKKSKKR